MAHSFRSLTLTIFPGLGIPALPRTPPLCAMYLSESGFIGHRTSSSAGAASAQMSSFKGDGFAIMGL